jgi:hypothetical protein
MRIGFSVGHATDYSLRNEAFIHLDELPNESNERFTVEGWQRYTRRRLVEAAHVLVRAEKSDLPFRVFVRLHALECGEGVVEDACGRIQAQILIRCDSRR